MDAHVHKTKKKVKVRVQNKKAFKIKAMPIIAGMVALLFLGGIVYFAKAVLTIKPAADWQEAKANTEAKIQLPKDDAAHHTPMEWWYYNGHLKTASGKRYSFHYTVFLVSGLSNHTVSHLSLADHQLQKNYTAEKRTAGGSSDATNPNGFEFNQSDWLMSGANGLDHLKANAQPFAFDLKLAASRAPILHGDKGIISMKNAGDSYYYSRSRLDVVGTLNIHNSTEAVSGIAWFDHQWGDLRTTAITWNWFSLMLDDGSDIMIYQFYDNAGNQLMNIGTLTKDSGSVALSDSDIHLSPLENWVSKRSGVTYPVQWQLDLPTQHVAVTTKAVVNDSEQDARLTTYNVYWEGAVNVAGSHTGQGFVEMNKFKH